MANIEKEVSALWALLHRYHASVPEPVEVGEMLLPILRQVTQLARLEVSNGSRNVVNFYTIKKKKTASGELEAILLYSWSWTYALIAWQPLWVVRR